MRCLLQRVTRADVTVDGRITGQINKGLLILVCAMAGDEIADIEKLARKIPKLRMFRDDAGKTNLSVRDIGGDLLVVSQFTLAGDTSRGNRPGFSAAAPPEIGQDYYERFCDLLRAEGMQVETGEFGAEMAVSLVNDGPMTLWMDSRA